MTRLLIADDSSGLSFKLLAKHPFEGVIVAAVSPRRKGETSIDLGATLELVDFLCRSGVNAIALLGSTGEFVHFALDDRRHMTGFAVKRSRVPVLVNVSHSTLDGAVDLAREAADSGVRGLLLMPPYYFPYPQEAIRRFYLDFLDETHGELPTFLYNIPQCTNAIEIETALSLLDTGLFAGIKDSSGSWEYFTKLRELAESKPFTILAGQERIFARARMAGAGGVVSGVASAVPELVVALDKAIMANDAIRIEKLDGRLQEFVDQIGQFPMPVGIKEAVRYRKLKAGAPAIGCPASDTEKLKQFGEWFVPWLEAVLGECRGL